MACVFAVDPGGLAPAGPARFTALALCLLVGAATLALARPAPSLPPIDVLAPGLALLGLTALSTATALDRPQALLGSPDRALGLGAWVGFAVAFAIGHALGAAAAERLARAAVVVVSLVAALALLELVGVDPTGTAWPGSRAGAPFAQPTYLGAALVLLGPSVVGVAADPGADRRWRTAAVVGAGLGTIALLATQSRGPMIGLAVALAAVAGRPRRVGHASGRRIGVIAAAGALAAFVGAVAVSVGARGWDVFGGRLDEWQVGMRAVRERPWLGAGPEGYRIVVPSVVDPDYVRRHGTDVLTDRAHNVVLDTALSSGVAAAACLVVLVAVVAVRAVRLVRDPSTPTALRGIAAGSLAMFAQQFVLFPLAELDPILWLFAGVVVAAPRAEPHVVVPSAAWARAVGVVGVAVLAPILWFHATATVAEHRLAAIRPLAPSGADVAARAVDLRPDSVRVVFVAARIQERGSSILDLDRALTTVELGLERHPLEPALRFEYGRLLVERAERSGLADDARVAVDTLTELAADAPNHPPTLGRLARALILVDELPSARATIGGALSLAPDDPELIRIDEELRES